MIEEIPESIRSYYNNYGTCLDIDYSIYSSTIKLDDTFTFYFTSLANLNKFNFGWEKWLMTRKSQYNIRYSNFSFENVFYILDFYDKIEKKGFRIEKNGERISGNITVK